MRRRKRNRRRSWKRRKRKRRGGGNGTTTTSDPKDWENGRLMISKHARLIITCGVENINE